MVRRLTERPFAVLLPLWPRVIFVDWNGVLCQDVYWSSIANNPKHPYHRRISDSRRRLFTEQRDLVKAWQKGEISSEAVISSLNVRLDRRCREDYLLRRLELDCRKMPADRTLLTVLATAARSCYIVLATDNVDSFFQQLDFKPELQSVLHGVLCSSVLGVLKGEDAVAFFQPWLNSHRLTFADALLLDDSREICGAFRAAGGSAIQFTSVSEAVKPLRRWLAAKPPEGSVT
jgi:hypothetical protein